MEGRPHVFSAGRFWLRSLLPGPSAARLRPRSSLGGLTTPACGTRAYSAGAASPVRVYHAAAPGVTRGPGLSGQGRPQVDSGSPRIPAQGQRPGGIWGSSPAQRSPSVVVAPEDGTLFSSNSSGPSGAGRSSVHHLPVVGHA
ncbi:hypothetical protein NDU88_010900 [Pleurodeles waltl]|uniref:Uncharacterized protein n=1 Tax=Pleurodeles waltl TaxID=8319 RepID=A0AAV7PWL1_PLEWA|nr:hypothetical protein NDU88_010900 [Pleurodeles waltl]